METAPQFIWRNLSKNMTVVAEATGKVLEYKAPPFHSVPDERCWLCAGRTHGSGMLVKNRIDEMFSDVHLARCKTSGSLCEGCAGLLKQRKFRFYSHLATEEGVRHPARTVWAEVLTNPPTPPWAASLSMSGQKHLFFKTQVNYQNNLVYVQLEDLAVRFDPVELKELLEVVERLYTVFSKQEILTGEYSSKRIQQYGLREFEKDEWYVSNYRGERLLTLAVWIARNAEARGVAGAKRERKVEPKPAPEPKPTPQPAKEPVGQLTLF